MDAIDPIAQAWFDMLNNNRDEPRARALLRADAVLDSHPEGRSKPGVTMDGIDQVLIWLQRMPPGRFAFKHLDDSALAPTHPEADRARKIRYAVSAKTILGPWSHEGDCELEIVGEQIITVRYFPDDPPPPPNTYWGFDQAELARRHQEIMEEARANGRINVDLFIDGDGDHDHNHDHDHDH